MMAWTDERMDDLTSRMDAGFARTDGDIQNLADRMDERFARTDGDIRELRIEIRETRTELKGDIDALRTVATRFGIAMIVCLLGIVASLVGVMATGALAG